MHFQLSERQLSKLSDLSMDIGKGLIFASIAIPVLTPVQELFINLQYISVALFFIFLSIKIEEIIDSL